MDEVCVLLETCGHYFDRGAVLDSERNLKGIKKSLPIPSRVTNIRFCLWRSWKICVCQECVTLEGKPGGERFFRAKGAGKQGSGRHTRFPER